MLDLKKHLVRTRGDKTTVKGSQQGGSELPNYSVYQLSSRQRWFSLWIGAAGLFGLGYVFFHNLFLSLLLTLGSLRVPKYWSQFLLRRRRESLGLHFKQALYSLSSSLAAGRSVENGFREAIQDLRLLYPDGKNDMISELMIICTRLEYGVPIEEALQDFSRRASHEDISNFADVLTTCKRTGGDLVEVVRRTSNVITEKLEVSQEISVLVAQKRMESKMLLAAPIFFLIFMSLTSPDYMKPLYEGAGLLISGFAFLLFGLCFWLINKIMDIRV